MRFFRRSRGAYIHTVRIYGFIWKWGLQRLVMARVSRVGRSWRKRERTWEKDREREIIKYPGIIILRVESLRSGIRWITFFRFFHKSFRSTLENCIIRGLKKALDYDKNIQTSIIFIKKQAHKRISRKKIFIWRNLDIIISGAHIFYIYRYIYIYILANLELIPE